jgi:DNA topoisomerase-3
MQSLYETHKLLTYPRTDCRYLSDEHFANRELILGALSHDHAPELVNIGIHRQHKAFNTEKITAHHAIVPTEKFAQGITLSAGERNIYKLVCESFIALFYPESVRDKTRVTLNAQEGRRFVATQSVLKSAGWEVLYKQQAEEDKPITGVDLRTLTEGTNTHCDKVTIDKKKTQPPKYFVESTLLAAMTRAAKYCSDPELRKTLEAKDKDNSAESGSIGTEATRASILAKLKANTNLISVEKEKGYQEAVWKTTQQGQELCGFCCIKE